MTKRRSRSSNHLPTVAAATTNTTKPRNDLTRRSGWNPSRAMPESAARISHPTESMVMPAARVT
jgi:hypothetical protein